MGAVLPKGKTDCSSRCLRHGLGSRVFRAVPRVSLAALACPGRQERALRPPHRHPPFVRRECPPQFGQLLFGQLVEEPQDQDPQGHQAQELRWQFGQRAQRTPPASLRLLWQQAFNENPEGVASSQPRASERSERHPGLDAKGYDSPPEGAKARTEAFKFANSILSVAAFAPLRGRIVTLRA